MVAVAASRPDPAEQHTPTRGVRVWGEGHCEGGQTRCAESREGPEEGP
jgi:hypothetical protein